MRGTNLSVVLNGFSCPEKVPALASPLLHDCSIHLISVDQFRDHDFKSPAGKLVSALIDCVIRSPTLHTSADLNPEGTSDCQS